MDFAEFKNKVNQRFHVNLSGYKEKQLKRRIETLMRYQGFNDFHSYFQALQADTGRWLQFMDKVTINVSEFFRNPDIFAVLEERVIPELIADFKNLKIWSAACSNGAEPYSLAMILDELGGTHVIHGTDMDEKVLAAAKQAKYPANIVRNVSAGRKRRYFTETGEIYQLKDFLKERVVFRRHDLLTDRYESGYHLIVCRNVTIYFTRDAQLELYKNFFKSLVNGGILFIGATESIINYQELGFEKCSPWFYKKMF